MCVFEDAALVLAGDGARCRAWERRRPSQLDAFTLWPRGQTSALVLVLQHEVARKKMKLK